MQLNPNLLNDYHLPNSQKANVQKQGKVDEDREGVGRHIFTGGAKFEPDPSFI